MLDVGELSVFLDLIGADAELLFVAEVDDWKCWVIGSVSRSEHCGRMSLERFKWTQFAGGFIEAKLEQGVVVFDAGHVSKLIVGCGQDAVSLGVWCLRGRCEIADAAVVLDSVDSDDSVAVIGGKEEFSAAIDAGVAGRMIQGGCCY